MCNFIHIFPDLSAGNDREQFHYGINTISAPGALGKVTYNVEHASRAQLESFLNQVLDKNEIPDIRAWKIIIDSRRKRNNQGVDNGNSSNLRSVSASDRRTPIIADNESFDRKIHKEIIERLTEDKRIWSIIGYSYDELHSLFLEQQNDNPEWGIVDDGTMTTYWWFSIVPLLMKENSVCNVNWDNDNLDSFIRALGPVVDQKDLDIERNWFNQDEEISIWCTVLQHKWDDTGYDIGVIDMDTDSCVFFIAKKVIIEELRQLTMNTAYTIDFAEF